MKKLLGVIAVVAASGVVAAPAAGVPREGERFVVDTNSYLVGQAPDWLDEKNVVFHDPFLRDDVRRHAAVTVRSAASRVAPLARSWPRLGSTQMSVSRGAPG